MKKEAYLGDGAYAEVEGDLCIYTSNGIERTNEIFFEPEVLVALLNFLDRLGAMEQLGWMKREKNGR